MKNTSTRLWRFLASSALALLGGCTAPAQTAPPASPVLAQPVAHTAPAQTFARPTFQKTALDAAPAQLKDEDNTLLGNPSNAGSDGNNLLVTRPQFTLSYNQSQGGPNWVSWHVQASDLGRVGRGTFMPDSLLPADLQIRPNDYRGSGFDRGHQCPSGDRTSSRENNNATFVMSNMLPQAAALNRQVWAKLESYCRDQVRAGNELYIVVGGSGTQGRIGGDKINVPSACWKIVVVLSQGTGDLQRITPQTRVIAVSMPNQDTPEVGGARWASFITTPASIEQATGFHFFSNLSPATRQALEQKRDSGRGSNASTGGQSTRPRSRRTRRAPSQFVPVPEPGASLDGPATDGLSPDVPTTSEVPRSLPQQSAPGVNPRAPSTQVDTPPTASAGAQVWVNTNTGVYHFPGTRWYGNTKQGQYMTEAAANAAGYRAAENGQ